MALWRSLRRPDVETKDAVSRRHSVGSSYVWQGSPVQMPMGSLDIDRATNDAWKRIVWVYRCIDARAKNLSRVRMAVFTGREPGSTEIDDHPLTMLLNRRSNPYETSFAFRYRFHSQMDLSEKGVFVEVVHNRRGDPAQLHLLHPKFTFPIADPDQFVSGFEFRNPNGEVNTLTPYAEGENGVMWFKRPHPIDPYLSSTWLSSAGISMDIDFYSRIYNRNFMLNDGKPGGLLVIDGGDEGIDDDTAVMLQRRFAGGVDMAGRLTVVEAEGGEYVDLSTTPRDAQYVESRQITKAEILGAAGTPESVFNASGRTYDNADAELEGWWQHELQAEGDMTAQGYEELTPGGIVDDSEVVGYVWDEVPALRRAQREREERASSDFINGLITVDEYREITGKDPMDLPGTRVLWLTSGKAPVGTPEDVAAILGQGTPAAAPGAPGQPPPDGGGGALPPGAEPPPALPPGQSQDRLTEIANSKDPIGDIIRGEVVPPNKGLILEVKDRPKGGDPFAGQRAAGAKLVDHFIALLAEQLLILFRKQEKVILTRLKGAKARKHTRHWVPKEGVGTTHEMKALDPQYIVDRRRWIDEAAQQATTTVRTAYGVAGLYILSQYLNAGDGIPDPAENATEDAVEAAVVAKTVRIIAEGFDARAEQLQQIVYVGDQEKQKTIDDIADDIIRAFQRAETWAQVTSRQVVGAMNASQQIAAKKIGATAKRWLIVDDERTRHTHRAAEGQVVGIDDKFEVGEGHLLFPGDPTGPIGEWINCRCTMLFQTPERDFGDELDAALRALDVLEGKSLISLADTFAHDFAHSFATPNIQFDPDEHPRDYRGRFLDTPDVTLPNIGTGIAVAANDDGSIIVALPDGRVIDDVATAATEATPDPIPEESVTPEAVTAAVDGPTYMWHGRMAMVPTAIAETGSDAVRDYLHNEFTGHDQVRNEAPDPRSTIISESILTDAFATPVVLKPGDTFDTYLGPGVMGENGVYTLTLNVNGKPMEVEITPSADVTHPRAAGNMRILSTPSKQDEPLDKPENEAISANVAGDLVDETGQVNEGDTPYFGTGEYPTFKDRLGNCYELSGMAATLGKAPEGSKLVYGTIQGDGQPPLGHAWVELPNGNIWEPVAHIVHDPDEFTVTFGALPYRKYSREEAMVMLLREQNYGPEYPADARGNPLEGAPTEAERGRARADAIKRIADKVRADAVSESVATAPVLEPVDGDPNAATFRSGGDTYTLRIKSNARRAHSLPPKVVAEDAGGHIVGFMTWHPPGKPGDNGTIGSVHVTIPHRRRGVATAMLAFARQQHPEDNIVHSDELSESGAAWAAVSERWDDPGGVLGSFAVLANIMGDAWAKIDGGDFGDDDRHYAVHTHWAPGAKEKAPLNWLSQSDFVIAADVFSYENVFKQAIIDAHAGEDGFDVGAVRAGEVVGDVTYEPGAKVATVEIGVETKDGKRYTRDFVHTLPVSDYVTPENAPKMFEAWAENMGIADIKWRVPGHDELITSKQPRKVDEPLVIQGGLAAQARKNIPTVKDIIDGLVKEGRITDDEEGAAAATARWRTLYKAEKDRLRAALIASDKDAQQRILGDVIPKDAAEDLNKKVPTVLYGLDKDAYDTLGAAGFEPGPGFSPNFGATDANGFAITWATAAQHLDEGDVVPVRNIVAHQEAVARGWATKRGGMTYLVGTKDGDVDLADATKRFDEMQGTWERAVAGVDPGIAKVVHGVAWTDINRVARFDNTTPVLATGGDGTITNWGFPPDVTTYRHEMAHSIDTLGGKVDQESIRNRLVNRPDWSAAQTHDAKVFPELADVMLTDSPYETDDNVRADKPLLYTPVKGKAPTDGSGPTDYGRHNAMEDFAESVAFYLKDHTNGSLGIVYPKGEHGAEYGGYFSHEFRFADLYPYRARYFDELFGNAPAAISPLAQARLSTLAAKRGPLESWTESQLANELRRNGIDPTGMSVEEMVAALRRIPGLSDAVNGREAAA